MKSKKRITGLICILIAFAFLFTACSNETLAYQNQFLDYFKIDFINSSHKKIETDKLKNYISIELTEQEKSDIEEFVSKSKDFCSITDNKGAYEFLIKTLNDDFSDTIADVSNGYFSIYSKITNQIIDLEYDDISSIDMDFFCAMIYDSENNIIYLFDYSLS